MGCRVCIHPPKHPNHPNHPDNLLNEDLEEDIWPPFAAEDDPAGVYFICPHIQVKIYSTIDLI